MIKKNLIIFLVFVLFLTDVFSQNFDLDLNKINQKPAEITNHSFLNLSNIGSEITITGELHEYDKTFVLIENFDSRSAVTFNLEVQKFRLKKKLRKLDGKIVTISGILLNADGVWTKTMSVTKIN